MSSSIRGGMTTAKLAIGQALTYEREPSFSGQSATSTALLRTDVPDRVGGRPDGERSTCFRNSLINISQDPPLQTISTKRVISSLYQFANFYQI